MDKDKDYKKVFSFRMDMELHDKVKAIANKYGGTQTSVIRACIEEVYNSLYTDIRQELDKKLKQMDKDKDALIRMLEIQKELTERLDLLSKSKEQMHLDI